MTKLLAKTRRARSKSLLIGVMVLVGCGAPPPVVVPPPAPAEPEPPPPQPEPPPPSPVEREAMLRFPPEATDRQVLPDGFIRSFADVGEAANAAGSLLSSTGHRGLRFVPVPGGVAVVAAAPQGEQLGVVEEQRILRAGNPVLALLVNWFAGRPGRHTAFLLLISEEPWSPQKESFLDDFQEWQWTGYVTVPPDIADDPISQDHYAVAALYVFQQDVADGPLILLDSGFSVDNYMTQTELKTRMGIQ